MTQTERQNAGLENQAVQQRRPMFHRVLKATPAAVRETLVTVHRRFRDETDHDTLGRLELVLAEVMNNITEHAIPDRNGAAGQRCPVIHLSIVSHVTGLACALTDDGAILPSDCLLPRNLPQCLQQDLPEGGFGWFLIQDLTQELCYYREGERNYLAFRIPWTEAAPPENACP
ncbi:MAG: ATP-binding protein [Paracoccus sp. (in: a-proteobacteria)]|nr:ATP-binding protein [Paracoccus sp. (in: a-proteobacteria)]